MTFQDQITILRSRSKELIGFFPTLRVAVKPQRHRITSPTSYSDGVPEVPKGETPNTLLQFSSVHGI